MFKFLGRLFGSDKALEGVVSGVSKGLDALVYTSEEKAHDAMASRSEARRMVVAWMSATQGQNLARRLIALSITFVWLSQFIVAQALTLISIWVSDPARLIDSADVMRDGAGAMNGAVMLILAFYFAAPHMGDIAKAVTSKFVREVK
jgi:hypothetical protein